MSRKTLSTPAKKAGASAKKNEPSRAGASARPAGTANKARVIAICNQKGGCGKTTSVINISAGLAQLGKRVLVVDLDSQCNATSGLGYEPEQDSLSTFDLMVRSTEIKARDVIVSTDYDRLDLMPGSIILSEFESRIASEIGRENKLKKALAPILDQYDFIILDTPPSLGLISVNALNAASEVQIAMQAHPFALDGLNLLLETIDLVQQELNTKLLITGVYITMFDTRTRISQEIRAAVGKIPGLNSKIFSTVIRQNVKVTEAAQSKMPVMYYDPSSPGAEDYMSLSREIAKQRPGASTQTRPSTRKNSAKESRA